MAATKNTKNKLTKSKKKPATKKTLKTKATAKKPIKKAVKAKKVKAVPTGYSTVTPYLIVKNAAEALKFYKRAFGVKEILRFEGQDGKVMHAEIKIGDSLIMLADEFLKMNARSPQTVGGTPVFMHLYVDNVDALTKKAIAAGATVEMPVQDRFYGDRPGVSSIHLATFGVFLLT